MLEVEVISKISHEQVLSYEPNCLNCIRTVGGKEKKKKIYVTLRNLKKQELNVQLTLKYDTIKLKKEKDHIGGFIPHQSLTKTVDLSPLEKKVEAMEIYSPYATGTFFLYLETIVTLGKNVIQSTDTRVKSLKAHGEGEVEELDFFKNFSHRSTIKKDNPSSFFFKADSKSSNKPAKQKGEKKQEKKKPKKKKFDLEDSEESPPIKYLDEEDENLEFKSESDNEQTDSKKRKISSKGNTNPKKKSKSNPQTIVRPPLMFTGSATPQPLYSNMDDRKKERKQELKNQIQFEEENPNKLADQLLIPDDLGSSPIRDLPEDEAESASTYAPENLDTYFNPSNLSNIFLAENQHSNHALQRDEFNNFSPMHIAQKMDTPSTPPPLSS